MTRHGTRYDFAPEGVPDCGVEPRAAECRPGTACSEAQDDSPQDMEDPMSYTAGLPLASSPTGAKSGKS
jgi:hypothetical protein